MKVKKFYQYLVIISLYVMLQPAFASDEAVNKYLQCEMHRLNIPGLSVAIVENGKIIKAKGYGYSNIEVKSPATAETIYQSGSIGKQFTATLALILDEKGLIKLDDKISRYIKGTPPDWKDITIRHLLTHSSGLTRYQPEADLRLDYADDYLIQKLMPYPLDFAPGTAFRYSNTGYQLLGFIMQKATGRPYGILLKDYIFNPLEMNTARIVGDRSNIIPNRAAGYDPVDGKLKNEDFVSTTFNSTADGSLYLSVLDLAKWDAALYTTKLLTEENKKKLWLPVKLANGTTENYGLGFRIDSINGHPVVEHGGEVSGFTAYISRFLDDGLTVIILTNLSGNAELGSITHHVAGMYNKKLALGGDGKKSGDICMQNYH